MTEQFWKFQIPTPILNIHLENCGYTFVLDLFLYSMDISAELRLDLRVSRVLGKHFTSELYSSPGVCVCVYLKNSYFICMTVLPAHMYMHYVCVC